MRVIFEACWHSPTRYSRFSNDYMLKPPDRLQGQSVVGILLLSTEISKIIPSSTLLACLVPKVEYVIVFIEPLAIAIIAAAAISVPSLSSLTLDGRDLRNN
jgi:hypothetical protein